MTSDAIRPTNPEHVPETQPLLVTVRFDEPSANQDPALKIPTPRESSAPNPKDLQTTGTKLQEIQKSALQGAAPRILWYIVGIVTTAMIAAAAAISPYFLFLIILILLLVAAAEYLEKKNKDIDHFNIGIKAGQTALLQIQQNIAQQQPQRKLSKQVTEAGDQSGENILKWIEKQQNATATEKSESQYAMKDLKDLMDSMRNLLLMQASLVQAQQKSHAS